MPPPLIVPVVAHRMYGRRFVPSGRTRGAGGGTPGPFGPGLPPLPTIDVRAEVDTSHGTRRSVEEIERLFHEGASPAFTNGWSVNRLWQTGDVQFVLVGIVDEMIDSHHADLLTRDYRIWPTLLPNHHDAAVNVYFFRQISGARGMEDAGRIVIADQWGMGYSHATREDAWRASVITLSHEFGHAFDLSHRHDVDNVMLGGGTVPTSITFTRAQALFARQRARAFRRPWYRNVPDDDVVRTAAIEVPHVAAYDGETLPTFD